MMQLTIIGNIGADATVEDKNGNKQVRFSVAVNEKYKKADGTVVESTNWVTVFCRQANLAPYLKKGTMVYVSGDGTVRAYQDKERNWCAGISINNPNIKLLSSKKEDGAATAATTGVPVQKDEDDLPF